MDGSAGPQSVAKDMLLYLARGGPGELIELENLFWPLLAGQTGSVQVGADLRQLGEWLIWQHSDDRGGVLAHSLVGCRHDRYLANARHEEEQLLDLCGADVLAAPNDHVRDSVSDGDISSFIADPNVASVVPAVTVQRPGGQFGIGVPDEAIRSAERISPGSRRTDLAPCGIYQSNLDAW